MLVPINLWYSTSMKKSKMSAIIILVVIATMALLPILSYLAQGLMA